MAVLWPWGGFGVVLDAEGGFVFGTEAFVGFVEEADMRDFDTGGKGFRQDVEAVVLRGDFNFACLNVLHWVVAAAMPQIHLGCFAAEGERQ